MAVALCATLSAACPRVAAAATPPAAQREISHLLEAIGHSGCQFFRNGTGYDPARAASHLRYKYDLLAAANQIASAEDFVNKAATMSSITHHAYSVRCPGAPTLTSAAWLRAELVRFRQSRK